MDIRFKEMACVGYVYLIRISKDTFKIGSTLNPNSRLSQLRYAEKNNMLYFDWLWVSCVGDCRLDEDEVRELLKEEEYEARYPNRKDWFIGDADEAGSIIEGILLNHALGDPEDRLKMSSLSPSFEYEELE